MSTIGNLMVTLGLNSKGFQDGINDAEKKSGGLRKTMGTVGKAVAGFGAVAVGTGVAAFAATKKMTDGFDKIAKNSTKLGVSTDAYQEMDYWAGQNGLSSSTMERAVGRLNQRIGRAADGNEKYSEVLEKMGINMDDVREGTVSTEDAMAQSIKSLSEMSSEQEKSAAASELFGTKLARDLMPALQDGSLSLEEAAKKAEELGIIVDGDALSAAEEFQDTWDDLTRSLAVFGQKILIELMPIFQMLMDWILDNMPAIQNVFSTVFGVIQSLIVWLSDGIKSLIGWFNEWRSSNNEALSGIWEAFQQYLGFIIEYWTEIFVSAREIVSEVFTFIVDFISEALSMIYEFWEEYGTSILETATQIFEDVRAVVDTVFTAVWEIIQELLGRVVEFIKNSLEKIKEFWDENGDAIMAIVETVFGVIRTIIEEVMPIITDVIRIAWDVIETIFDTTLDVIMGLIEFFIGFFTADFEKMDEAIRTIVQSMWEGIKSLFASAWDLISGPLNDLDQLLTGWFDDLMDSAVQWGKNMIQGFIDGIGSMGKNIRESVSGVMGNIGDYLKFWSPAKKGEGRYITHWGANMVDGFLDGVKAEASEAGKIMNDLVHSMNPDNMIDLSALLPSGVLNEAVAQMPSTQTSPDKSSGGGGTSFETIYQNLERMFEGATFYVRSEEDIRKLARELFKYIEEQKRKGGGTV